MTRIDTDFSFLSVPIRVIRVIRVLFNIFYGDDQNLRKRERQNPAV